MLKTRGNWDRRVRRKVADELRETSLSVWGWLPLLRTHAWYVPHTSEGRNWLAVGILVCVWLIVGNLAGVFDQLPSTYGLAGRLTEAAVLFSADTAGVVSTRIRARHTGNLSVRDAAVSAGLVGQVIAIGIDSAWIGSIYGIVVGVGSVLAPVFVIAARSDKGRKYITRIRNRHADQGDADRDTPATPR
jgi:hypothetical protein